MSSLVVRFVRSRSEAVLGQHAGISRGGCIRGSLLLQTEIACWNLFSPSNVGPGSGSGAGVSEALRASSTAASAIVGDGVYP